MATLHQFYRLPSVNAGAIISVAAGRVMVTAITPPMDIEVPVRYDSDYIREFCSQCQYFKSESEVLSRIREANPEARPSEWIKQAREWLQEHNKCGTSSNYGTRRCLAGHNSGNPEQDPQFNTAYIKTPYLAWVNSYSYGSSNRNAKNWKLYAFKDSALTSLHAYQIANVWPDGRICWGGGIKVPLDHHAAFQQYFNSQFNRDLMAISQNSIKSSLELFRMEDIPDIERKWTPTKALALVSNPLFIAANRNQAAGALLTQSAKFLDAIPAKYLYRSEDQSFAVGWVQPLETGRYLIDFKGFNVVAESLTSRSKVTALGALQTA